MALLLLTIFGIAAVPTPRSADAASKVELKAVRSWSAPTHTRIVFDFSSTVFAVAPDSGASTQLVLTIPGEHIVRATDVPGMLNVADGVVEAVEVTTSETGARFNVRFTGHRNFKTFSLQASGTKPHRLVVDVIKPGGQAAQAKQVAGIAETKQRERTMIVAIDAGHGGEDPGSRGPRGLREKDVVMAISQATVAELEKIPGIKPVLTRRGDYFIPLHERYKLAERMEADVFISIHANSSPRRGKGAGTEVYFLSLRGASEQAVQDLADKENAADLVGGVPYQADDELVSILYDVKRSSALKQSELLAEAMLDNVTADTNLRQRGVKQGGFIVLKSVEFPSVIVEVAFINNPNEAKLLKSKKFQQETGAKIARGVKEYFDRAGIRLKADSGSGTGTAAASAGGN